MTPGNAACNCFQSGDLAHAKDCPTENPSNRNYVGRHRVELPPGEPRRPVTEHATAVVGSPFSFLNLPEPTFCGFACMRNRHHRGLHQWEAVDRGMTVREWREHLAETNRPASCLLDAGEWATVRSPCD